MSSLFDPLALRGMKARNRIWLAPMCQYSVESQDGIPTDWHLVNLGARAAGGFGLVMAEATAIVPEGRITPQDVGLWSDSHAEAWERIAAFIDSQGAVPAIQLAHAGRKASTAPPWDGGRPVGPEDGGWNPVGPSRLTYPKLIEPMEMTVADIETTVSAFATAAARAVGAGFTALEVHAAHGYLLHEFLSPLSNRRTDRYGCSFENRTRIVAEVVDAIRATVPDDVALIVRVSATDWVLGGWTLDETVRLSSMLKDHGVDMMDLSSGGNDTRQAIPAGPGYQVPFASAVRRSARIPTAAVGLITEPVQAQQILDNGDADVVLLGRSALRESGWPFRAAHELGVPASDAAYPRQYAKGTYR